MRIVWIVGMLLGTSALAETFSLKNMATGELSGPFEFLQGSELSLGTNDYAIVMSDVEVVDVRELMQSIQIKALEFRQADVRDVIEFFRETSRKEDPAGVGVNFVMLPFETTDESAVVAGGRHERVTMNLRDVSLLDALLLVKKVTGYRFQIKSNTIFIQPK